MKNAILFALMTLSSAAFADGITYNCTASVGSKVGTAPAKTNVTIGFSEEDSARKFSSKEIIKVGNYSYSLLYLVMGDDATISLMKADSEGNNRLQVYVTDEGVSIVDMPDNKSSSDLNFSSVAITCIPH